MDTFYTRKELCALGLRAFGENVYIGRQAVLYHPESLTLGHDVRIDDFTIISGTVTLGNYIHIAHFCGLYGGTAGIEMEDYTGLSSKCSVYATTDDYSGASMTNPMIPQEYEPGAIDAPVKIQRHAIVGASSLVMPGVTVSEGTALGSMSLCNKTTQPWSIYVGIPAKKIKERSKELLKLASDFEQSRREPKR